MTKHEGIATSFAVMRSIEQKTYAENKGDTVSMARRPTLQTSLFLGISWLAIATPHAFSQDNATPQASSTASPPVATRPGPDRQTSQPAPTPVTALPTSPAKDSAANRPPTPRETVASEAAEGMRLKSVPQDLRSPSIALGGLFAAIGGAHLEPDFKTIADSTPDEAPSRLLQDWEQQRLQPGFSLKAFYEQHFSPPIRRQVTYKRRANENIFDYIQGMWGVLTRQPDKAVAYSSLLPLPHAYVVPGGRFSELYYWDTYFTMIGLYESDQFDLLRGMIEDMASLIDRYGHIPNGTRTYYLSRSEPPYFALMVDLLAQHDGQSTYRKFLPQLQREYDYWMDGAARLPAGQAYRHVVRLKDGTLLNRHWDDLDTPRDESYPEDVATANEAQSRPPSDVYRDLRAGGETGWDFSSRWLADGKTLSTIHTTDLAPIEVNCLMAHLEQTLAHAYAVSGKIRIASQYGDLSEQRIATIRHLMWNESQGAFFDYDWKAEKQTTVLSAATAVPLFLLQASQAQALAVAETIRDKLLKPGGIVMTDRHSGQQWDAPNGWAPGQWMAIKGLSNYGASDLATEIARRWMTRVIGTYEKSGVLLEKYDVEAPNISPTGGKGGGEYPMQIGFGWTNGTLLGLMNRYPTQTNQILRRNPLANQPPVQALPPLDPYSAQGPENTQRLPETPAPQAAATTPAASPAAAPDAAAQTPAQQTPTQQTPAEQTPARQTPPRTDTAPATPPKHDPTDVPAPPGHDQGAVSPDRQPTPSPKAAPAPTAPKDAPAAPSGTGNTTTPPANGEKTAAPSATHPNRNADNDRQSRIPTDRMAAFQPS